jgi:hypothetical protein
VSRAKALVRRCTECKKREDEVVFYPRACKTSRCKACDRAHQRAKYQERKPFLVLVSATGMRCNAALELDGLTSCWGANAPLNWRERIR